MSLVKRPHTRGSCLGMELGLCRVLWKNSLTQALPPVVSYVTIYSQVLPALGPTLRHEFPVLTKGALLCKSSVLFCFKVSHLKESVIIIIIIITFTFMEVLDVWYCVKCLISNSFIPHNNSVK